MSKEILEAVREASISIACCLDEPSNVSKKDLEHIQELQFEKRPTNTDVLNKLFDILKNNSIDYIIEKLKTKKGKKNG